MDGVAGELLHLPPGVPVVVDASEPLPVQKAAQNLCRDLEWVLKTPSPLLTKAPDDSNPAIVVRSTASAKDGISGAEAHAIVRDGNQVRLTGTDLRGTIYAI